MIVITEKPWELKGWHWDKVFFDFGGYKQIKVMMVNEIMKIEG